MKSWMPGTGPGMTEPGSGHSARLHLHAVELVGAGLEGVRVFLHRLGEETAHQALQKVRSEAIADIEVDLATLWRNWQKLPLVLQEGERAVEILHLDAARRLVEHHLG